MRENKLINVFHAGIICLCTLFLLSFGLGLGSNTAEAQSFNYTTITSYQASVLVIKTASDTIVAAVPLKNSQWGVTITPDGAFAYKPTNDEQVNVVAASEDPFRTAGLYVENNSSLDLHVVVTANYHGPFYTRRTIPPGYHHVFEFPWGNYSATANAPDGRKTSTSGHVKKGGRDAWYINNAVLH